MLFGQLRTPNNLLILFVFLASSTTSYADLPVDPVNIRSLSIPEGPQHFLFAVGGGYRPSESQVVLEKNLTIVHELASTYQHDPDFSYYLFGAGRHEADFDVQALTPTSSEEKELLSALFEANKNPLYVYRHNELGNVLNGSANKKNIQDIIHHVATSNKDPMSDKFRFYFSGHGSPKNKDDELFQENTIHLWNNEEMNVQQFSKSLDELPPTLQAQVVMVQCYSGGFSQINYEGGIKNNPLSAHNRCGFFSQLPFLTAAGCTPDITKREEYSNYFFSAYRGRDEKDNAINADYNRDGVITSDEAHAYTIINENSIDIPVTTSLELLRDQQFDLSDLSNTIALKDLLINMNPSEKEITFALTKHCNLDINDNTLTQHSLWQKKQKIHEKNHVPAESKVNILIEQFEPLRAEFQNYFQNRYEFFKNDPSPLAKTPQESIKLALIDLKNQPNYEKFKILNKKVDAAIEESDTWEKLETKWLRLFLLVTTKLSEKKLKESNNLALKEKYRALKACESSSFF